MYLNKLLNKVTSIIQFLRIRVGLASKPPKMLQSEIWGVGEGHNQHIPKTIWVYWEGNSKPKLIEICLERVHYFLKDWQINVLNEISLLEYLPDFPSFEEGTNLPNKSDLIRLMLLEKYGGVWMDASILLTTNFDWILNIQDTTNAELFAFYNNLGTNDKNYPVIETYFLAACKGSKFIQDWCKEWKSCFLSKDPQGYYKRNPNYNKLVQNLALPEYLICYLSAQEVMQKSKLYRIALIKAEEVPHFYNIRLAGAWNFRKMALQVLGVKQPSVVPKLIKITGKGRMAIDEFLNTKKVSRKSILGKFL